MKGLTMMKIKNPNHPKKGSTIKVNPITKLKDIDTIKKLLADKPLDYAIFVVGINTALRASDLLNLKVFQVKNLKIDDSIVVIERKTKKERRITFNRNVITAIQKLLNSHSYDDMDHLFKGQRGTLTVPTINAKVKAWCKSINLKGNFGSHTLRKTFGYHQRVTFKVDLPTIQQCFGHHYQKETLIYLCIQPAEIKNMYKNEL